MMKSMLRYIWLVLLLGGCATYELQVPEPGDEKWAPSRPKVTATTQGEDGGLYRGSYMMTLFQDRRAYRIGDILTVVLEERTQSSKKANTSMSKNSSMSVPAPSIGGKLRPDWGASLSADRDFDGGATSSQQNTLAGSITVTVAEVMPNGVLAIRGEKWIRLNQGDEYIRLGGMVRVDDIDQSNRISSQRIADARITYAGRGALADSNQMGWLGRFFSSAFAPF
ncbi:flagellar basal body L-ring protein FlgH [Aeromonas finlandensis]|uniref:flagellar basal body L-ring protein FlgH n=1 Tax=Aeromonas finlandensis TaxID=1543375 RepID=UPI00051C73D2|nr:flagellar basal body L-ring protein FlgH [Aeromonas finlandensis]